MPSQDTISPLVSAVIYETALTYLAEVCDPAIVCDLSPDATRAAISAAYPGGWNAFLAIFDELDPFLVDATFGSGF